MCVMDEEGCVAGNEEEREAHCSLPSSVSRGSRIWLVIC